MGNSNAVLQPDGLSGGGIFNFVQQRRNKAFNEKKFRYMGGKTFLKFYKEDTWPLLEEIFERLNISELKGYDLFRTFAIMDQNENGKISLNEIFQYLKYPRTKLTERLFDFSYQETKEINNFNNFSKKELTFLEFSIRIWNFCTLKNDGLARYLFEVFDIEELFYLNKNYLITMYHMVYNTPADEIPIINEFLTRGTIAGLGKDSNTEINNGPVQRLPINFNNIELLKEILSLYVFLYDEKIGAYVITKDSFIETCCKKTYLIEPIIRYQKHLQKKIGGGLLFWRPLIHYRYHHPVIVAYDFKSNTLQDSIDNIISSVDDFISMKKQRESESAEALLQSKSEKLLQDKAVIEKELTIREKQLKADIERAGNNELLKRMQRKWDSYHQAKNHFIHEEFTTQDVWRRREMRLQLYEHLDIAVEAAREYYAWKDKRDIQIMEGTDFDHETRLQDFINNRLITSHYDPRLGSAGGGGHDSASVGGLAAGSIEASVTASSSNDENVFNQIIMTNGKFIYDLLSLIKLYDITLNKLQTDMETDPKKQTPVFKEKELELYNTLIRLQQHYSNFKLLQPEDYSQQNPLEVNQMFGFEPLQEGSLVFSLISPPSTAQGGNRGTGGKTSVKSAPSMDGGSGVGDSLEMVLQRNEKQKKMTDLIEKEAFEEERKLIKKYMRKNEEILLAEKFAHDELLVELKEKVMKMCFRSVMKHQQARERSFFQEEFELMQNQGSRITRLVRLNLLSFSFVISFHLVIFRWEYVLEKDENKFYYVNVDTLEFKHPKTAICEFCDAFIVQNELACDQCQRHRSPKNKLLYRPLGYKDITLE